MLIHLRIVDSNPSGLLAICQKCQLYQDLGDTFIHYGTKGLKGDTIGGTSDQTTYTVFDEAAHEKRTKTRCA